MEPYRLRRWRLPSPHEAVRFFTCARPGRSKSKLSQIPDDLVHKWIRGLPGPETVLVSLLGRKPDGMSEFAFYSFCGGFESPEERGRRVSFQEWLDRWHRERGIQVVEHPTRDYRSIPPDRLAAIASDIARLAVEGQTVVLVDSGGETRSGAVCRYLGAKECSTS